MADLKPCPFCGGEAETCLGPIRGKWGTRCKNCDVWRDDRENSEAEAIAAWNRRAPDPRDEVIRGLCEAVERSRQYIAGSMADRSGPLLRQLDAALAAARQPYMGQIMAECDCQRQGECQRAGRCIAEVR